MDKHKSGLTGSQLKLLAIVCMTIDHAAVLYVAQNSALYFGMRCIGRLTAPIMAFMLAEGFAHTQNFKKYLGRLLLFGVISQPFFYIMQHGSFPDNPVKVFCSLNMMFSLALGLVVLKLISGLRENWRCVWRYFSLAPCLALSEVCDWKCLIPFWAMLFWFCREKPYLRSVLYLIGTSLLLAIEYLPGYDSFADFSFQLGTLTDVVLILLYNGERGDKFRGLARWGFYLYYPAHIAILILFIHLF